MKRKPSAQNENHTRSRYVDHSRKFVEWVNGLGLEKTLLGKFAQVLDQRFRLTHVAILFLFCLSLASIVVLDVDFIYTGYRPGDLVKADVKSPVGFDVEDEQATAEKRLDAELSVPPVFDSDPNIYEGLANSSYRAFREMRRLAAQTHWPRDDAKRLEVLKDFSRHKTRFEEILGVSGISERGFEWMAEEKFNVRVEQSLIKFLDSLASRKIAQDAGLLRNRGIEKIVARIVERGGVGDEFAVPVNEVLDLAEFRRKLHLEKFFEKYSENGRKRVIDLASDLVAPNLILNRPETAERQKRARDAVLPVMISVKKGQVVVREGSIVQPVHMMVFDEIRRRQALKQREFVSLMIAVLLVAVILVFGSYIRRFSLNKIKVPAKDFASMALVTIVVALIAKLFLFITTAAFQDRFAAIIPSTAYTYLIPVAAGPMLVGLVITWGEVVWLYTAFLTMALSLMVDANYSFLFVSMAGGIAAARGVYNCKKRNDIYFAGVRTGLVNALLITLITLVTADRQDGMGYLLAWNVPAGFLGGVMSSMVAMTFVPLLETIFNYTTDVKLLELSNLNHPLLKEMIVKAPGTYHHSLVVGSMVEAAAEEIGANPLLAKVSAYYHDIGKTEHAGYFIENQRGGYNPHDHISPNMSKTVLIAHVKDGVELGHKYKLGQPIIDVVMQHHGTTLISFFYHKAKQSEDPDMYSVAEEDFRYPGPKPQFKEAALCMLADSIEAAARCLDEPHPVRLQNIVKNIIHSKFMDGQLDQCNLTLKDLSTIEESFNRILLGIYHQRIDYPAGKKPGEGSGTGGAGGTSTGKTSPAIA